MTTGTPAAPRTFDEALAAVTSASGPADLLGADPAEAARRYRRLIRLLHPDTAPAGRRAEASAACAALNALRDGRPGPADGILTTRRNRYRLGPTVATGDLTVLRSAHCTPLDGSAAHEVLLKIPRAPADNDLLAREAEALARLARQGEHRLRAYAPTLVESFEQIDAADPASAVRRVNALRRREGLRPLTDLLAARPDGLDPRDAAWIWRRLLVALGYAHRAGVRHGAVLPEHILVDLDQHGLVLIDWCYSVSGAPAPLPALVERHRHRYPAEVTDRRPATEATDIHLASLCMAELMGAQATRPLLAFIRGCTLPSERQRPHDAWKLLAELDELLERLYGPRTFRPLHLT